METIAMNIHELTMEEMGSVYAGTFTPNTYSKDAYHAVGIWTSYHFFDSDEFRIMGRSISEDEANAIVRLARLVSNALNEGRRGNDVIGYTEPAFIRAFNSQLYLKFGIKWNGTPGNDF